MDDGATVTINEHETKTQKYSGGSRLFTLDGFRSGELIGSEIKVRRKDGRDLFPKFLDARGGKYYEIGFDSTDDLAPESEPTEFISLAPNQMTATLIEVIKSIQEYWLNPSEAVSKPNTGKTELDASTDSLNKANAAITSAKDQLMAAACEAVKKTEDMIKNFEKVMKPPAKRVYKLESGKELRATLAYNDALQIIGIEFDASHLVDTITFIDENKWVEAEVATSGMLTLSLRVRLKDGSEKDILPAEPYPITLNFTSSADRTAKIQFAKPTDTGLKKWIEDTVAKNKDETEKFGQSDNVTALIITGEFRLGFAKAQPLSAPLNVTILK